MEALHALERVEAVEMRDQVLGILGHDLRTPLTAIMAAAQTMLKREELAPNDNVLASRIVNSAQL